MEDNEKREPRELIAGKFESVDALVHAYEELQAEFTRRSQKLKTLEESGACAPQKEETGQPKEEAKPFFKGVNLLGGEGTGVTAPDRRPKNIREAGALALGYLKKTNG